jgi:hypothetical protein
MTILPDKKRSGAKDHPLNSNPADSVVTIGGVISAMKF